MPCTSLVTRPVAPHVGRPARPSVRVEKGEKIPECPNGHKTFDERTEERPSERPGD